MKIQNAGLCGEHTKTVDRMWHTFLAAMESGEFPSDEDKWGAIERAR